MASVVGIYNLALSHIGQAANVSSPNEQSLEAELCTQFYAIVRDTTLEDFAWTFAAKRGSLALLADTVDPWLYGYALPADCLKPRRLQELEPCDDNDPRAFLWEGSTLYSNVENATLIYTYALTDTTKFSTQFTHAVSRLLASYIAGPILKDQTGRLAQVQYNAYQVEVGKAKATNANADRSRPPYVPSSIRARYANYPSCWNEQGEWIGYPSGFQVS